MCPCTESGYRYPRRYLPNRPRFSASPTDALAAPSTKRHPPTSRRRAAKRLLLSDRGQKENILCSPALPPHAYSTQKVIISGLPSSACFSVPVNRGENASAAQYFLLNHPLIYLQNAWLAGNYTGVPIISCHWSVPSTSATKSRDKVWSHYAKEVSIRAHFAVIRQMHTH